MKVRIQEQYKPHATKTIITGYLVYAYEGHPLLGKIRGSERVFKDRKKATQYARALKTLIKQ